MPTDESGGATLDHVAIAVNDLDGATALYTGLLGIQLEGRERVDSQGVDVAMLGRGTAHIELVCPFDRQSGIARFLEKHGEGLHHVCIAVPDLRATLAQLKARGVQLIDEEPRPGAGGAQIAFVHPRGGNGVLIELTQRA